MDGSNQKEESLLKNQWTFLKNGQVKSVYKNKSKLWAKRTKAFQVIPFGNSSISNRTISLLWKVFDPMYTSFFFK